MLWTQRRPLTKKNTKYNDNATIQRQHYFYPKDLLRRYFKSFFGLTWTKQTVFLSDTILERRKEGFNTFEADQEYWKKQGDFTFNPI